MNADRGQGSDRQEWGDIVALMRRDVRELGRDGMHAARFLQRCTSSTEALSAQLRRRWGLNAHEMLAVSTLWEFGRMTMTDLGRRIPLSRAAVTTLTDRLERMEYVRRVPDPSDRRRILLEVTGRVEEDYDRIHGDWNRRVKEYVAALPAETWASVVDVLADLRDMARGHADELRALSSEELAQLSGTGGSRRRPDRDATADWW